LTLGYFWACNLSLSFSTFWLVEAGHRGLRMQYSKACVTTLRNVKKIRSLQVAKKTCLKRMWKVQDSLSSERSKGKSGTLGIHYGCILEKG